MPRTEIPGKSTPERIAAAAQLKKIRNFERNLTSDDNHGNSWNRDLEGYLEMIGGITGILAHAKRLKAGGVILDIGSGSNRAITELANLNVAKGLTFIGTNLTRLPFVVPPSDSLRIIRTPAETLRGIEDTSVSAVVALASIAYSAAPELVVSSIDRVLVPGGVIKAHFKPEDFDSEFIQEMGFGTHDAFSARFRDMGYDVEVRSGRSKDLMLALKPGGNPDPFNHWWSDSRHTAASLMRVDSAYVDQLLLEQGKL